MKSETVPAQQVFQDRRQYLVPFYQRAYVWNKDEQWEPLWNDIADKAEMRSKGETPSPHFPNRALRKANGMASLKLPIPGSPERLNASAPALEESRAPTPLPKGEGVRRVCRQIISSNTKCDSRFNDSEY
jgi:hypothetical protein